MALEVCVGSFYLVFLMTVAIKDTLMFFAIQKANGRWEHLVMLMVIFDVIVLMTLPLAMAMVKGVC